MNLIFKLNYRKGRVVGKPWFPTFFKYCENV